jgi:hypothetical protein
MPGGHPPNWQKLARAMGFEAAPADTPLDGLKLALSTDRRACSGAHLWLALSGWRRFGGWAKAHLIRQAATPAAGKSGPPMT